MGGREEGGEEEDDGTLEEEEEEAGAPERDLDFCAPIEDYGGVNLWSYIQHGNGLRRGFMERS